jgi:cysteine desulfurase
MTSKKIYLDWNATTPVRPNVIDRIERHLREDYGNPSSVHSVGRQARKLLTDSREKIALYLGLDVEGLFFTGSGTESINTVLKGAFYSRKAHPLFKSKPVHFITSAVEHEATLRSLEFLKSQGADVSVLDVDRNGLLDSDQLKETIRPGETALASFVLANNETGVIQNHSELVRICHESRVPIHFDCVQALGKSDIDFGSIGAEALSFSAHKIGAPKGVGALYLKQGFQLEGFLHGGKQERSRRAGTENLLGILGFAEALSNLSDEEKKSIAKKRDRLQKALSSIPGAEIVGKNADRTVNTVSCVFEGIEGEGLLMGLDLEGICVSSGSACSSGSMEPSHVLVAMGYDDKKSRSAIRFSLGFGTSEEEINRVIEVMPVIVDRVRQAPL